MRRLVFINKVGKNENSYVVGSTTGAQSRFVRSALKKHSSNNSQGLCCDMNDSESKISFLITYAVTNINLTDLSVAQRQTLTNLLKNEFENSLNINRDLVVIDLTQDYGALVIYVSLKPETPNLKTLSDYFIRNAGVKTSAENVIQTYLDTISVGTVGVTLQETRYVAYTATIPPSIYNLCTSVSSNVNVKASNGNKYVLNNGTFYDPYVRYNLNNGYYELNNIPVAHPLAILNNSKTNLIKYIGDPGNKLTHTIAGTTDDAEYDFYHGNVRVYVYGDFTSVSLYCRWHGYMGGENLLKYDAACPSVAITAPTITIGTLSGLANGSTTNDSTLTLTFATSAPTTNLVGADITATNGIVSNFTPTSPSFYTATFTPIGNGATTLQVLAGAFTDDVGNNNAVSSVYNWTYFGTLPTMDISGGIVPDGSTTGDPFLDLVFTSSSLTTDFVAGDITVTNGVLSEFDGSGTIYTAKFTPTAGAGVVATTINVAASVFTGAIGNSNAAATEFNWSYDNTIPTIAITSSALDNGAANNDATIDLTFISTLGTSDFDETNIGTTNGTLTGFTPVSDTTYTATLTPSGQGATGVTIATGTFTGTTDGNSNTAILPFVYNYDTTQPAMVIGSGTISNGGINSDVIVGLTFTSSKPTNTFTESDIVVTNGVLNAFTITSSTTFTANFTPTAGYSGVITINVAGGLYVDAAGNSNTAATEFNWTQNSNAPYITISSIQVVNGGTSSDASIYLDYYLSVVQDSGADGFTLSDIVITGGTLGTLIGTGGINNFSTTVTPTPGLSSVTVRVNIPAGIYIDINGNANIASEEFVWNYDSTGTINYTLGITSNFPNGYYVQGADRNGSFYSTNGSTAVNINVNDTISFTLYHLSISHPFWLKNSLVSGTSDPVAGVTNNGSTSGTILFTPTVAGTYYYVCENHVGMNGTIIVTGTTQIYTVDVTAPSSSAYVLSGTDSQGAVSGNNPDVNIDLGDTINFNVNASSHPFWLKTVVGAGTANPVSGGSLTNNGTETLTVSWTPTVAGTYYYVCQHHGAMNGKLIVT